MNLTIFLPAYNEAQILGRVLENLPQTLPGILSIKILVVDDGSSDQTSAIARQYSPYVVRHSMNRGVGLATITGLKAARRLETDLLITMDSDGQHDPQDIPAVLEPILLGSADMVIGTRLLHPKGMPWIRRAANKSMNVILYMFSGVKTTDSQSGFRAYNRRALEELHITTSGYEVCTELLIAAKRAKLRVQEIPIRVIYTDYSKQKGQRLSNAVNILIRLIVKALTIS